MLTDEGTTVVKVYLHISREEQRRRLQARLDDPTKRWKFRPEDLEARKQWDAYQSTYEEAITETSTDNPPWRPAHPAPHWARDKAAPTPAPDRVPPLFALLRRADRPRAGALVSGRR